MYMYVFVYAHVVWFFLFVFFNIHLSYHPTTNLQKAHPYF